MTEYGVTTEFGVYVPTVETVILRGSGIVGRLDHLDTSDPLLLYFEGNKFDAANIVTFADRCLHAAGRMIQRYPTVARMTCLQSEMLWIGYFDYERGRVALDGMGSDVALARWLDLPTESVPAHELERS